MPDFLRSTTVKDLAAALMVIRFPGFDGIAPNSQRVSAAPVIIRQCAPREDVVTPVRHDLRHGVRNLVELLLQSIRTSLSVPPGLMVG